MISIEGHELRTLAEPIQVNGRTVKQVWTEGNMVYPEECDIIKVRLFTEGAFSHTDDQRQGGYYVEQGIIPYGFWGPCTSGFSVRAVGAMVLKRRNTIRGSEALWKAWFRKVNEGEASIYSAKRHGLPKLNVQGGSGGPTFVCPLYGASNLSAIAVDATNLSLSSIKLKYQMSPVPVCGPYQIPLNPGTYGDNAISSPALLYTEDANYTIWVRAVTRMAGFLYMNVVSYETYRLKCPTKTIVGPSEFNGRVFAYPRSGDELSFTASSGYAAKSRVAINIASSYDSAAQKNYYTGLNILPTYRFPLNVTKITGDAGRVNETEEFYALYYREEEFPIEVPIAEVLYAGKEADAPAWAKVVTEDDLQL